jgi:hypothetical protein
MAATAVTVSSQASLLRVAAAAAVIMSAGCLVAQVVAPEEEA